MVVRDGRLQTADEAAIARRAGPMARRAAERSELTWHGKDATYLL